MLPGAHILAGFKLGRRHRRELADLVRETTPGQTLLSLDPSKLRASGIRVLALDFDGVLACHGAPEPDPAARNWLDRAVTVFGAEHIAILSNKPSGTRLAWFGTHFPGVRFVAGVRKKPFPDGLLKVSQLTATPVSAILMVDDRLMTGCLAAIVAGATPCWINRPSISLANRPLAELLFMLLRRFERMLVPTDRSPLPPELRRRF